MSKEFRKKLIVVAIAIFLCNSALFAQQLPLFSQYMMNDFYINPAVAGTKDYAPIVIGVHKQWVGMKEAPSTQTLSGHTSLYHKQMGFHHQFDQQ